MRIKTLKTSALFFQENFCEQNVHISTSKLSCEKCSHQCKCIVNTVNCSALAENPKTPKTLAALFHSMEACIHQPNVGILALLS